DDDEWADILDEMDRVIGRQPTYASFRELGPKQVKELEVVRDLFNSLKVEGGLRYRDLRLAPEDPPDCVALTADGKPVAIEVTEFVSQEAVRINEVERRRLGRRPKITELAMAQWSE